MTNCPAGEQLRDLLQSSLSEGEQQTLEEHLQSCATCLDSLARLTDDADLPSWRQTLSSISERSDELDPTFVRHLKKYIEPGTCYDAAGSATSANAGDTGVNPPSGSVAPAQESYPFLSPSQDASELGRLASYRVLRVLGAGGMGMVFLAEDIQLQRPVALKVMKPGLGTDAHRQRFLREARAAAKVRHEHVVTIYQVGEEGGGPFLAMELLEGESLDDRLHRERTLPVAEVVRIGRQVAEGLAAAHARALIHRDIKPGNVWLEGPHGKVKLLDFGLARSESETAQLTQSGAVVGTPAFMAPEQARGEAVDARSDLFSLGALLYRMASGRLPFRGEGTMAVLTSLATEQPPPVAELNPEVPAALEELIMELLTKDPAKRPASANDIVKRLRAIEAAMTARREESRTEIVPALQPAAPQPAAPPRRRLPRFAAAAAIVLLALLPLGYYFGATVIRFATNQGELVVEADDDDIEIVIKQPGKEPRIEVIDKKSKRVIELTAVGGVIEAKEKPDGLRFKTTEFELARAGRKTFSARMLLAEKAAPQQAADPDRRAAEWALFKGGKLKLAGREAWIDDLKDLPGVLPPVLGVDLDNKTVADADLAQLGSLKQLAELRLHSAQVTDQGLAQLKRLTNLKVLNLGATAISDAGLVHVASLPSLELLFLHDSKVTDAGLERLKPLHNLKNLNLHNTAVTVEGLAQLRAFPSLTNLGIDGKLLTDEGLRHLQALPKLRHLALNHPGLSDAVLTRLASLPRLIGLSLTGAITDAHLKHLHELRNLTELGLTGANVTPAALAELKKALPNCWVMHVPAGTDPDRRAAAWVLSIGGMVRVNDQDRDLRAAADLPRESFRLTFFDLNTNKQVSDAGLAHFKHCKDLTGLQLNGSPISNAGLAHFKDCKNLTHLDLTATKVSDAGLAHLKDCKNLRTLGLAGTQVSDAGLAHFKDCRSLTNLELYNTQLSDAGLERLAGFSKLSSVNVKNTKVTETGVKKLSAALQACRIEWDGGVIAPDRRAAQALADRDRPFVLRRAKADQRQEFKHFAEAIAVQQAGDTIEVFGNGPFQVPRLAIEGGRGLKLIAAPGYRPLFEPAEALIAGQPWIAVNKGAVYLEGCDFRWSGGEAIGGDAASLDVIACRFLCQAGGSLGIQAPKIRIADSFLWLCYVSAVPAKAEVELSNNVVHSLWHNFYAMEPGGQVLRLVNNTFVPAASVNFVSRNQDRKEAGLPVVVHASGNIIQGVIAPYEGRSKRDYNAGLDWHGRDNLYVGPSTLALVGGDGKEMSRDLAGWSKYWGRQEKGSQEAPEVHFQWDFFRHPDPLARLRLHVDELRGKLGPKFADLGPDWSLVGPGDAYVRALAAEGKPVPKDKLRPAAPAGGPFVLLQKGKPERGFVSLAQAANAAGKGDAIEIRTDGPFPGCQMDYYSVLSGIRAAPGYRPVLEGVLRARNELHAVEGIHFRKGNLMVDKGAQLRVANCSFEPWGDTSINSGAAATEIVHCLFPSGLGGAPPVDAKTTVRNSHGGWIHLYAGKGRKSNLLVERSVLRNDKNSALYMGEVGAYSVTARNTLFETPLLVEQGEDQLTGWQGFGNCYRLGSRKLMIWSYKNGPNIHGLEPWRKRWNSDQDSVEDLGDWVILDPQQWRLLPTSAGDRAGPEGKDFGADVTRVARPK